MSKILVVDDEPELLSLVAFSLEGEGYEVVTGGSAAAAVEQAKLFRGGIQLLVVNHSVKGQAGRDLVDEIKALQPQLHVLRISGHLESELRAKGEMHAGSFFLQKPFLPTQLIRKVQGIIGPA